jgi:hypothetical protein
MPSIVVRIVISERVDSEFEVGILIYGLFATQ